MSTQALTKTDGGEVPSKELSPVKRATSLVKKSAEQFAAVLPPGISEDRFVRAVQVAILKSPRLAECADDTIYSACMESARVGLMPDGRQATIIPRRVKQPDGKYRLEAHFSPMAEGIIDLFHRSDDIAKVEARVVRKPVEGEEDREGDDFEYEYGVDSFLRHRPKLGASTEEYDPRVSYAYLIVWWSNGADPTIEVMEREEIERARQAGDGSTPAWRFWYGEMARKTVLRRGAKWVDLEPEAAAAIAEDLDREHPAPSREDRSRAATDDRLDEIERELAEEEGGEEGVRIDVDGKLCPLELVGDLPAGYAVAKTSPGWYVAVHVPSSTVLSPKNERRDDAAARAEAHAIDDESGLGETAEEAAREEREEAQGAFEAFADPPRSTDDGLDSLDAPALRKRIGGEFVRAGILDDASAGEEVAKAVRAAAELLFPEDAPRVGDGKPSDPVDPMALSADQLRRIIRAAAKGELS